MGQQQSKDELLYQQVNYANIQGIKALHREGAGLEWIDRKEGKTPLIAACLNPNLYQVAKTLIELGANVNAYRPGSHAGTPLHHAVKRGLDPTVKLLLMHGANPLVMNDDCQTPLDVAREKGHCSVVRTIELATSPNHFGLFMSAICMYQGWMVSKKNHICLFSGWLREFYGPGFLEVLSRQLVSRKIWAAVLPCGTRNSTQPFKLELAIYSNFEDARPRTVIALWKANLDDLKIHQSEPTVTIIDNTSKARIKLGPANETEKQQIQWFSDACKGIPQAMHPAFLHSPQAQVAPATAPPMTEDLELAFAIGASIQSPSAEVLPQVDALSITEVGSSSNIYGLDAPISLVPSKASCSDMAVLESPNNGRSSQHPTTFDVPSSIQSSLILTNEIVEDGPIHYPSIDSSPAEISSPTAESLPASSRTNEEGTSSCVICLDAPVEGACVPCGHMAGCMSCLNEIKAKEWGCPVCRTKINQIIRLYAV